MKRTRTQSDTEQETQLQTQPEIHSECPDFQNQSAFSQEVAFEDTTIARDGSVQSDISSFRTLFPLRGKLKSLKFCLQGYVDPLLSFKAFSLPYTLPENLDPTSDTVGKEVNLIKDVIQNLRALASYRSHFEFAIYLKNHHFKLVKQDAVIVGPDEIMISKIQYEQWKNNLSKLSKDVKERMPRISILEKEQEKLHQSIRILQEA
ncbi:hypothetical protein L873DRAFT_1841361 [Choiromyces venosus 120613-1]|uniref:Uncharacterized protein n=1 Tax=Choiromyces venosus 120613-1 TaxID=1336337 RepID=A0A3N4K0G5_9PEZI|nr:hypothetical protein L873DRAFT_1841361 [Choiromyces venosus 120613-1]